MLRSCLPFRVIPQVILMIVIGVATAGCSWTKFVGGDEKHRLSPRVVEYGQRVPKGGGRYKIGNPYKVGGVWYHPKADPAYEEVGVASWYGSMFHGRYTANGEIYDMDALTAAHPTLPLPSYVRVTNRNNGRSLILRVNDRGPYSNDRIIDVSRYASRLLDFEKQGVTPIHVVYLKPAPLNGDDSFERRYLASRTWRRNDRRPRKYSYRRSYRHDRITTGNLGNKRNSFNHRRYGNKSSRSQSGYIIQAGVYQSRWNANRMRRRLSRYGRTAVKLHYSRHAPLYRVVMGPYRHRTQADRTADRIAKAGVYDAIVINN